MTEKRVTVNFDEESYYLDGEYWESWDNYGEEMADAINELLNEESNKREQENEQLKKELDLCSNNKLFSRRQLEKENEELKQTIKCICKDYEESHGMDIRNAEWFTAW